MSSEIAGAMTTDSIRYSQVWEDHALLEDGLEVGPDDDVLSITSAGDNVLALLLREPRSVIAFDLSPAQNALLELKLAALRVLEHADFARLLGVRDGDRLALYQRVRPRLGTVARAFWDVHQGELTEGVAHAGRLERYLRALQLEVFSPTVPGDAIQKLLAAQTLAEQQTAFKLLASEDVKRRFMAFTGRDNLARRGRDPAQFRFVDPAVDVGRHFWERFENVCTRLPVAGNFYLEFLLTSRYRDLAVAPRYLRPSSYARLQGLVERVSVVTAELGELCDASAPGRFSKANLSDIFEYASPEATEVLLAKLTRVVRPGGRLAYWNLLVPRSRPASLAPLLIPQPALARALHARDRSWFYGAFQLEEVSHA